MRRRTFLSLSAAPLAAAYAKTPHDEAAYEREAPRPSRDDSAGELPLEELTIDSIQESYGSGRSSSRALTEAYIGRIRELDFKTVNAVIEMNPEALALAEASDRERRQGQIRGPLHGVPVLIKDNIDTADRMSTTAGSLALYGSIAAQDSAVAARLRAAGAVILGKTNLSEWANFRSNHSVSGWSARGGQTRNPYALDRNPSGSSSGTGAAVSANFCAAGVGTETDGSVVSPSSCCGLVGIKPTVGLIGRSGIIPISHTQDTAGPMARTVRDAAILLTALAGADPRDPATQAAAGHVEKDYTLFLKSDALKGARLGVARKFFGTSPGADQVIEGAIAVLKTLGAEIVDPADLPSHGKFGDSESEAMLYEFKDGLNQYLAGAGSAARVKTLTELIAFNTEHASRELAIFGQDVFESAEKKGPLTEKAYQDALEKNLRLSRAEGIDAILKEQRLDALIAPTNGPACLIDVVNGDQDTGGCSSAAAVAGYPHITVPAGYVHGLPVGISFFGTAWSEPRLLGLAYSFEQATKIRKAPRFLAAAEF
jgi:amidase